MNQEKVLVNFCKYDSGNYTIQNCCSSLSGDVKINNRPNVNSILHLFGGWLFEAAFIGNEDLLPMKGRVSTYIGILSNDILDSYGN